MTQAEILTALGDKPYVIVKMEDFLKAFPGYCLTKDQSDFQRGFFLEGGPSYNPRGKDRDSQMQTFSHDNKLTIKMGAGSVMFYRGVFADVGPYTNHEVKALWLELDREFREEMKQCGAQFSTPLDAPPVQNNRPPL